MLNNIIKFFLENKLVTGLILLTLIAWGIATAPFDWDPLLLPRDPVPVDAIPDLGENQQIVYTEWSGRSTQDIEDRSEEHTSELQSLMRISYAVFCMKKKNKKLQ